MLWSFVGCLVDASVGQWRKTVGGLCRAPPWLWQSLGFSWPCLKEFEHVFTTTVVIALHQGCISHTFRALAQLRAKIHSPDVLLSICSQGLGLEHGWLAQRSLRLQNEMSCVLQPLSAFLPSPVPVLQSSWHHVTLLQFLDLTKKSRTHPLHPNGNPLSTPLSPPLAHKTYATAPATGVVAASKPAYPDQLRQSSPLTICVRVSIDERRHQVVCTSCGREYLQ